MQDGEKLQVTGPKALIGCKECFWRVTWEGQESASEWVRKAVKFPVHVMIMGVRGGDREV